jgi:hypothetical protein
MNRHVYKLTASSLAMSLAVVGCTPSVQSQRPMALSAAYSPQLEKIRPGSTPRRKKRCRPATWPRR